MELDSQMHGNAEKHLQKEIVTKSLQLKKSKQKTSNQSNSMNKTIKNYIKDFLFSLWSKITIISFVDLKENFNMSNEHFKKRQQMSMEGGPPKKKARHGIKGNYMIW